VTTEELISILRQHPGIQVVVPTDFGYYDPRPEILTIQDGALDSGENRLKLKEGDKVLSL
jgi:hypothetical protein